MPAASRMCGASCFRAGADPAPRIPKILPVLMFFSGIRGGAGAHRRTDPPFPTSIMRLASNLFVTKFRRAPLIARHASVPPAPPPPPSDWRIGQRLLSTSNARVLQNPTPSLPSVPFGRLGILQCPISLKPPTNLASWGFSHMGEWRRLPFRAAAPIALRLAGRGARRPNAARRRPL